MYLLKVKTDWEQSRLLVWTSTNKTVDASWCNELLVWCRVWEEPACTTFLWLFKLVFTVHVSLSLLFNETKDTSMTATMLLHDSMLKPSVFKSPSETRRHPLSPVCSTKWQIMWSVTQTNTPYAFQWFCSGCSSAPLDSLPYPEWHRRKHEQTTECAK